MSRLTNRKVLFRAAAGMFAATSLVVNAATTDFGRVDVSLSAREDYDSNIFLTSSKKDDFVTTGNATVNFTRDVGIVTSKVSVGAIGLLYADHSSLNTADPFGNVSMTYTPSDKTTVSGSASLARVTAPNETVNNITTSTNFDLSGDLQNLFSEKLGYRLLAGYREDNYQTDNYADILSYWGGAKAVYVYSPKLTMTAGYTHRESWVKDRPLLSANPASQDEQFTVGFEGELAPKVSGTLEVGGEHRSFRQAGFNSSDGVYVSSRLKWVPMEKTSINLDASQDFDTSPTAQSSKTGSLTLSATQTLDKQWSVDGSIGYSHAEYRGGYLALVHGVPTHELDRTDDTYRVKGRIVYAVATNVSLDLSAGYSHNDSTIDVSTYNRVIIGVGLTASF